MAEDKPTSRILRASKRLRPAALACAKSKAASRAIVRSRTTLAQTVAKEAAKNNRQTTMRSTIEMPGRHAANQASERCAQYQIHEGLYRRSHRQTNRIKYRQCDPHADYEGGAGDQRNINHRRPFPPNLADLPEQFIPEHDQGNSPHEREGTDVQGDKECIYRVSIQLFLVRQPKIPRGRH